MEMTERLLEFAARIFFWLRLIEKTKLNSETDSDLIHLLKENQ